jgi:hypothetical protein
MKSWSEAAAWTRESSLYLNQSWDDNPDLFKADRNLARAILMPIAFMVLPPDFLNSGGKNKPNVGGCFCHFDRFFVFTSFDDTNCSSD